MKIEVTESKNEHKVQATINEHEFIRLYGLRDFIILTQNGEVGDVIGQRKWYKAKVIEE